MADFRADLHCHSTCSDGTYTPENLVKLASESGLMGLSITDHDTVEAYSLALPLAQSLGVELISGVEFSTELFGQSVHVLGYCFQVDHPAIQELCQMHMQRREERNLSILEKLKDLGKPLSLEEIIPKEMHHTIGRPHIAQAMIKRGYVETIQEAFKKYIGDGKPAYAKGKTIPIQETLDIIHTAHGKAIMAHPHLIDDNLILRKLLEMNFDGIECYYAKFNKEQNARWIQIAQNKNWLITGGSDFHGNVKPTIPLGASWIDRESFNFLIQK